MGDALAGEKRSALALIGLQYDQIQTLEAQNSEGNLYLIYLYLI